MSGSKPLERSGEPGGIAGRVVVGDRFVTRSRVGVKGQGPGTAESTSAAQPRQIDFRARFAAGSMGIAMPGGLNAEIASMDASAISARVAAEFSYAVAARVMDIAREGGDSSVALIQAAAKAAEAGNAATEEMVSAATQMLDVYA